MAGTPCVLAWTWRKTRRFGSKGEAERKLKVWKAWYERRGWRVTGSLKSGYVAYAPDYEVEEWWLPGQDKAGPHPKVHSAAVRTVAYARERWHIDGFLRGT